MLKLGFKGFIVYIKRKKNMTFVLIGSYVVLLFFISFFYQMNRNVQKYWVDSFVGGDIIVNSSVDYYDYFIPPDLFFSINYDDFINTYRHNNRIFAPRLRSAAVLEKKQEKSVIIIGIDPDSEKKLGDHLVVEDGRWCKLGQNEIMLESSLASTLGAKIGDTLIFATYTIDGYPSYELLTLTGLLKNSVDADFSNAIAYMPLDVLQKLIMVPPSFVTEIATNTGNGIKNVLSKNFRLIKGTHIIGISRMVTVGMKIIGILVFSLFTVFLIQIVSHNLIILMEERLQEISVFLTFGAKLTWLRGLLFLELFLYTLFCGMIGSFIEILTILGFNSLGIYSFDLATEILLSSSHFLITLHPVFFIEGILVLFILICAGAFRSIIKNTGRFSIRSLRNEG